jgi:hypothetical protein
VQGPQLHRARLLISQEWSDEELTATE